jgi:hypothetical protein
MSALERTFVSRDALITLTLSEKARTFPISQNQTGDIHNGFSSFQY